jgi:hypothetical protein
MTPEAAADRLDYSNTILSRWERRQQRSAFGTVGGRRLAFS